MSMWVAITREISPSFGNCELTHLERQAIDVDLARRQHHHYEECLAVLGCRVQRLPAEPDLPDSVFVEDVAIVLDELAIITRPGADSRKPETESITKALKPYRKLYQIQAPGTLDGGDVLCIGKSISVGLSSRSNRSGIEQMRSLLEPQGYTVKGVQVGGCLHLKSAVTQVAQDTLLVNPQWVDSRSIGDMKVIEVDPGEPYAANAVWMGEAVVYPTGFSRTRQRLEQEGISVMTVDVSEIAKAEGAVTCCSLVFLVKE
jgi:dimethylargininase